MSNSSEKVMKRNPTDRIATCDWCGRRTSVFVTHHGTGFGYNRLVCHECAKELGAVPANQK